MAQAQPLFRCRGERLDFDRATAKNGMNARRHHHHDRRAPPARLSFGRRRFQHAPFHYRYRWARICSYRTAMHYARCRAMLFLLARDGARSLHRRMASFVARAGDERQSARSGRRHGHECAFEGASLCLMHAPKIKTSIYAPENANITATKCPTPEERPARLFTRCRPTAKHMPPRVIGSSRNAQALSRHVPAAQYFHCVLPSFNRAI